MFNKNRKKEEFLTRFYLWLWVSLAFQAGFVNAGGFLACARFVSHATGFGTQVGISLSQLDYWLAFEMFSAPLAFMLGAVVSGFAIDRRMLRDRKPHFLAVTFGMVLIFAGVTFGGISGFFGDYGEPLRLGRDFALMAILCFVCGMQNACFGSLTQGQIRTTHLTGILTDIGVTLVKVLHFEKFDRQTKLLKRMNYIRILTFASFSLGSMIAAIVFARVGWAGFGFVTALSALIFARLFYLDKYSHRYHTLRARGGHRIPRPAIVPSTRGVPRPPKKSAPIGEK